MMRECKPVSVSNSAFIFCKFTIAGLLWFSVLLQSKHLLFASFIILALSAILKVKKAPLIVLYSCTVEKLIPGKVAILEENSICFAHTIGAVFSVIGLLLVCFVNPLCGWIFVTILAVLKSIAGFGYCGAAKLYICLTNPEGQCCRTSKTIKKIRDRG